MTLTVLPGTTVVALLTTLDDIANKLNTARSGGKFDVFTQYLRWANEAGVRLSQMVVPRDVTMLVLTQRHWAIQGIDPAANEALMSLLQGEIDERVRAFAAAQVDMRTQVERWQAHGGKLVIADTNVYLHHGDIFDEADWGAVVHADDSDEIEFVVPLIVVDELDHAKRGKAQTRTRARITLRAMEEMFQDPLRPAALGTIGSRDRIRAHLLLDDALHVRLSHADSELVDRCRALADIAGRPVTLVTSDTGMALRARAAGLTVAKIDTPDPA